MARNRVAATPVPPTVKAAAGAAAQIDAFYAYTVGATQEAALSVPTVTRSVQLVASVVGTLSLRHYSRQWTGERYEKIYIENEPWMEQPDPRTTRNFMMSMTVTDLMLQGRAFWYVTSRSSATSRPLAFQWLPAAMVQTLDQAGPQFFGPSTSLTFNGLPLDADNVVQFLAPQQGLLFVGNRAISTALKLQNAADRFAVNEIAAGWIQQTDGSEPMSAADLGELVAAWRNARASGAIGALNSVTTFKEFSSDPDKLQLLGSRQFQSLELSRSCGIPAYLLGIGVPGQTYANAQQARQDLYLFGAKPYLDAIQETLSMTQILPRGRFVEFDLTDYLTENALADVAIEESATEREMIP